MLFFKMIALIPATYLYMFLIILYIVAFCLKMFTEFICEMCQKSEELYGKLLKSTGEELL